MEISLSANWRIVQSAGIGRTMVGSGVSCVKSGLMADASEYPT